MSNCLLQCFSLFLINIITWHSLIFLNYYFLFSCRGHIVLVPEFSLPLEYYLIPFLIIVGICLILIVIFMVGKSMLNIFLNIVGMILKTLY